DCIANGGANGCAAPAHDSLQGARGVAVSADGKSVYVASFYSNSITRFKRDTTTGALNYKDCIANAGANGCAAPAHDSLGGATGVAVSADGKSVYATSPGPSSISRFKRNTTSGALTYKDCIANGGASGCAAPAHDSLSGPHGLAVSADGKS